MPLTPLPYTEVPAGPAGLGAWGTVDWNALVLYTFVAGPTAYFFNARTRAQTARIDFSVPSHVNFNVGNSSVGPHDGRLYCGTNNASDIVQGYNPSTDTIDRVYNDTIPGTFLSGAAYVAATTDGTNDLVVTCGLNAGQGTPGHSAPVNVVNMSTLVSYGPAQFGLEAPTSVTAGNARVGRAPNGAYVTMGYNGVVGIYKVDATHNPFIMTRLAGYTGVPFGGTNLTNWAAPCYDASDGNIIACVTVDNTTTYMVKFNGISGAIIWQTAIFNQCQDLRECSIANGRISWVEGSGGTSYESSINTATGALSRQATSPTTGNNNAQAYFSDKWLIDIWNVSNSPGANPMFMTFGPPVAPFVASGGVQRHRS